MIKLQKVIHIIAAACISIAAAGNNSPGQQYIGRITAEEWLSPASVGVLAVTAGGDTLVSYGSTKMLVPASNMKLIATGTALHSLGSGYRFETGIGYSGEICDGTLEGDLYIIGGGDPVLGSKSCIATPVERTFSAWKGFLEQAGIKKIDGRIIGDDRFFDRQAEEGSWQWNDIGTYYGSGTSGLTFYENMKDIRISAGEAPGKPVKAAEGYPDTPWMEYRFCGVTGKKGTGNSLYMYTSAFAPEGEMRGSFAIDRNPKTEKISNKFPAYTCAWHFMEYLALQGVECTGGAADLGTVFGIPEDEIQLRDSLVIIGTTQSPKLSDIAFETNHESNNVFAETLFKVLGKEYCGTAGYESSYIAAEGVLHELGVDTKTGLRMADGCGLSRQNSVSPDFLCRFLKAMTDSPAFIPFAESLPSPGGRGTLSFNMKSYSEAVRSRIRAKSGSMNGVRCYSGYIIPPGEDTGRDTVIFSIMVNGYFGSPSRLQDAIDRLMFLLSCSHSDIRQKHNTVYTQGRRR